jgi:site-specific DNA recombinase
MFSVAPYARYSPDQQRQGSIENQLRLCRIYPEKQGWSASASYHDRAVSGVSLIRSAIQALLTDARRGLLARVLCSRRTSCPSCCSSENSR